MARWIKSGCQVGERCAHAQQNHKTDVSAHAHTGVPMHNRRDTCSALHSARTGRQIPQGGGNQLREGDRELPYKPKQQTNNARTRRYAGAGPGRAAVLVGGVSCQVHREAQATWKAP